MGIAAIAAWGLRLRVLPNRAAFRAIPVLWDRVFRVHASPVRVLRDRVSRACRSHALGLPAEAGSLRGSGMVRATGRDQDAASASLMNSEKAGELPALSAIFMEKRSRVLPIPLELACAARKSSGREHLTAPLK